MPEPSGVSHYYRKKPKPATIEAFQMTRERRSDNRDWPHWLHEAWNKEDGDAGSLGPITYPLSNGEDELLIVTRTGARLPVRFDDYIIRCTDGDLYTCKPDIFEATYEKV